MSVDKYFTIYISGTERRRALQLAKILEGNRGQRKKTHTTK